jgi:hypothetical protein
MRKGGQNTLDPRFAEPRRALVRVCALADHEALTKLASTWGPQGSSVRGVYTAFTQQFPTEILHRVSLRGVHEAGPRGSEIPWTPPACGAPASTAQRPWRYAFANLPCRADYIRAGETCVL